MPFGIVKQYLSLILGVLGLLALSYVGYKVYDFGYSRAETKYLKEISEINRLSADLLKKQIEEHNAFVERQNKVLNSLRADRDRLDQIVKENEVEASKDTNAKRPAISKSGVMRLNRIR